MFVTSGASDAITSKDDLYVPSGTITATASDDGLRGKDSLTIAGGEVAVTSGEDALKSNRRNIPIILETAAMNERLKSMGYYSARDFNQNVLH